MRTDVAFLYMSTRNDPNDINYKISWDLGIISLLPDTLNGKVLALRNVYIRLSTSVPNRLNGTHPATAEIDKLACSSSLFLKLYRFLLKAAGLESL
jgi:hypothetical protein